MHEFDYTPQQRRPTVAQIVSDWKKAGRPKEFSVSYGETYAHFEYAAGWGAPRWQADGNGCRGVERDKVQAKLNSLCKVEED